MTLSSRALVKIGIGVLAGVILAVTRPWTVRPLETQARAAFDPASYVDGAWPKIIVEANSSAVDTRQAIADASTGTSVSSAKARFVRGRGVAVDVDQRSRVGVLHVRLDGAAPVPVVALQIGPVLRGTAVRDAASFVHFTDFANQTDFAAVANGLNDCVLTRVLAPIDISALRGQSVTFIGAMSTSAVADGRAIEVVPLALQIDGGRR